MPENFGIDDCCLGKSNLFVFLELHSHIQIRFSSLPIGFQLIGTAIFNMKFLHSPWYVNQHLNRPMGLAIFEGVFGTTKKFFCAANSHHY